MESLYELHVTRGREDLKYRMKEQLIPWNPLFSTGKATGEHDKKDITENLVPVTIALK